MFKSKNHQIAELRNELTSLKAVNHQLLSCSQSADNLCEQITELQTERNELRKQVREQTAADILVNALQATGIMPDKKERPAGYYADQNALLHARLHNLVNQLGRVWGRSDD